MITRQGLWAQLCVRALVLSLILSTSPDTQTWNLGFKGSKELFLDKNKRETSFLHSSYHMEVKTISKFSGRPNTKTHSFKSGYSLTVKSRQVDWIRSFISTGCLTTAKRYDKGMKSVETERIEGNQKLMVEMAILALHGTVDRLTGTTRNGGCEKLTLGSGENGCISETRMSPRDRGSTPQKYQVWT